MNIESFKHIYFRIPIIIRLLVSVLLLMLIFGTIISFVEPNEFKTIFDGVWWVVVTGATIGYGDLVPQTVLGRLIGIVLMLTGGGLLTFYITSLSSAAINHEQDLSKGKISYKGKNHIIVIGWNERTRQLVRMIEDKNKAFEIVLIDRTVNNLPYRHFPVHFIHGDPSEDATLIQANIQHAASVIITSDITKKERQADVSTILTTVAIRGNNEYVPINAEILSISQVENAIRAGANTVISSNDFMSTLFYHEIFHQESTRPFETILAMLNSQQFIQKPLPEKLTDCTFQECVMHHMQNRQLLIGIIRDDTWTMNPPAEFKLKKDDRLLVLMSWQEKSAADKQE
ncbi:potassium channel family protein [Virgibacillus siamensis]|uniref:potassium channel family protein n=1 Tax=Virgibacillus siamensis TaxID=480071 RepID=UPI00098768B1|nr:potassium channel family protein [Virgibacillus siamensis]